MELLEGTAKVWSEAYGEELSAESIRCDGCRSTTGNHSITCVMCQVRVCALGRGIETCALCGEYGCDTLEEILGYAPEAREKLDEIRGL